MTGDGSLPRRIGLTQVAGPEGLERPNAHVIFVHGVRGQPYKTWAQQGNEGTVFWPRDLLPGVLPNANVYTWGYDADVDKFSNWSTQGSGTNTVYQHAQCLIGDVADSRPITRDESIPVIFVAHSLGGILVKAALTHSSHTSNPHLQRFANMTKAIIFLGTPHRGSSAATLAKNLYRSSSVLTRQPSTQLLVALEKDSPQLDVIADQFLHTMQKHDLQICSFREEQGMRVGWFFSKTIVKSDSAKIGDHREELHTIPADHRGMARYASSTDVGFERISAAIARCIERSYASEPGLKDDYEDCLSSLYSSSHHARFDNVTDSHSETFHWLFDREKISFAEWLSARGRSMYWIKGKPGSGKSTLMKFAVRDSRTQTLLSASSSTGWIIVSFFFHDRGGATQKSLTGMLQGLLYQLLRQAPELMTPIRDTYKSLTRSQGRRNTEWDYTALRAALLAIIEQPTLSTKLCMFIDALDEHAGDKNSLVDLLNDLITSAERRNNSIKIIVASRTWNVFEARFGTLPSVAIHEYTRPDIEAYTTSNFQTALLSRGGSRLANSQPQELNQIARLVTDRAHGVFIWVRLVVDELAANISDGTPLKELEDIITNMPIELEDLYRRTLNRVDGRYAQEAEIVLSVAACAQTVLLEPILRCTSFIMHGRGTEDALDQALVRRINSRSGGLLETFKVEPERPKSYDFSIGTQFVHQTAKEFILNSEDIGLRDTEGRNIPRRDGHLDWLRTTSRCFEPWADVVRPYVFDHAYRLEEAQTRSSKTEMILDGQLSELLDRHRYRHERGSTISMVSAFGQFSSRMDSKSHGKRVEAVIAVAAGLKSYVRYYADQGIALEGDPCLLQVAAFGPVLLTQPVDRLGMVRQLLDLGYDVDYRADCSYVIPNHRRGVLREQMSSTSTYFDPQGTPVSALFAILNLQPSLGPEEHGEIIDCLLRSGANPTSPHVFQGGTWTPLDLCAFYGNIRMLERLLNYVGDSAVPKRRIRDYASIVEKYQHRDRWDALPTPYTAADILSQPWHLEHLDSIRQDEDVAPTLGTAEKEVDAHITLGQHAHIGLALPGITLAFMLCGEASLLPSQRLFKGVSTFSPILPFEEGPRLGGITDPRFTDTPVKIYEEVRKVHQQRDLDKKLAEKVLLRWTTWLLRVFERLLLLWYLYVLWPILPKESQDGYKFVDRLEKAQGRTLRELFFGPDEQPKGILHGSVGNSRSGG